MFGYKHLRGYLERYTIIKFWRVHVRFHRIKRPDITPFLHSHPFHYLSIVLWGGYSECLDNGKVIKHSMFSVIPRSARVAHRILTVEKGTLTLFFTVKTRDYSWRLEDDKSDHPAPEWIDYPKGIYLRELYGRKVYSKFDRYWHKAANCIDLANTEMQPSIDQSTAGTLVQQA